MKWLIITLLLTFTVSAAPAQDAFKIDSLRRILFQSKEDTNRVNIYSALSWHYRYSYPDTALIYALPGVELARKLKFKKGEILILNWMGEAFNMKGNYSKALEIKLKALQEAEKFNDPFLVSDCQNYLGALYLQTGDYQEALFYYGKAKANDVYFKEYQKYILNRIGACYLGLSNFDSAYYHIQQSYELDKRDQNHWTAPYYMMAEIYYKMENYEKAIHFFKAGNDVVNPGALDIFNGLTGLAVVFNKIGREDSAIYYAKKVVIEGMHSDYSRVMDASSLLTDIYKSKHAIDSAFKYQQIMLSAKDSLFSQEKVKFVQNLSFNEQMRQQQAEQERQQAQQQYENKVRLYSLLAGLFVISLIAFILYRNNRQKQKINALLEQKNEEIQAQRDNLEDAYKELGHQKEELQTTLEDLQATQTQLIQKEKMASLGELTAGIAHEIQNPLNFVQNFSEVNKELIEELEEEIDKGNIEEIKLIMNDIKENEQKVLLHGKRADAIVKSMLQHSKTSSGEKQLTDINALADEYLRLAYQGLRAKDKDFNANLFTDFDKNIGNIDIVPQEIGRVLVNLFNNAFYALGVKKAKLNGQYQPQVIVSTKKVGDKLEIRVRDNGIGIPESVKQKIFQPFFTTKPTGEGTGLGLSLSYDIITKGHGGELKVDTKEREYTEFTITLPSSKVANPV